MTALQDFKSNCDFLHPVSDKKKNFKIYMGKHLEYGSVVVLEHSNDSIEVFLNELIYIQKVRKI